MSNFFIKFKTHSQKNYEILSIPISKPAICDTFEFRKIKFRRSEKNRKMFKFQKIFLIFSMDVIIPLHPVTVL